ncbi:hypothetical protein [Streptomyces sp. NPDC087317]|uniref:hypothetical protein n=1 Tax=Streptomyces sp. NPDC087317 TaxID=3365784 RepID=UPI003813772C
MNDYVQAIKAAAVAMNGQSVVLNLVGGQSLAGTLAYASSAGHYAVNYPDVLTVTVSGKAHTVRLDHVTAIGQS